MTRNIENTEPGSNTTEKPRFAIFRAATAPALAETGMMTVEGLSPVISKGLQNNRNAGGETGYVNKTLFSAPGFSLVYAWFKSNFPLPLHTHNTDCLYYIIAGKLRLGTEVLGPGDGFFVPADVPYGYTPEPGGVEVLEFRHEAAFNIKILAKNPAYWARAVEIVAANKAQWQSETAPSMAD